MERREGLGGQSITTVPLWKKKKPLKLEKLIFSQYVSINLKKLPFEGILK